MSLWIEYAYRHPVRVSFLVAIIARGLAIILGSIIVDGVLIPDEMQYIELAAAASDGRLSENFWPGYGQEFFASTRTFMLPLTGLFWLFGPWRIVGQVFSAVIGALVAAVTTATAGNVVRRPFDLLAGLIVALLPSQVLFSSAVLRESLIWLLLATLAWIIGFTHNEYFTHRLVLQFLAAGLVFVALADVREQTAILALWSLASALMYRHYRRPLRVIGVVALLLVAPTLAGMGIGGEEYIGASLHRLGSAYTYQAINADTGFLGLQGGVVSEGSGGVVSEGCDSREINGNTMSLDVRSFSWKLLERDTSTTICIRDWNGNSIVVDNSVGSNLKRLPRGLINTLVRPYPWEFRAISSLSVSDGSSVAGTVSWAKLFAGLESFVWVVLYLLALVGVWGSRGKFAEMMFPIFIIVSISLSGAIVHGNLGTAFRHRGQFLFALAILASGGVQVIGDRQKDTQGAGSGGCSLPS